MDHEHQVQMGAWKILIAWIGMAFGSINVTAVLTIIALALTIVFTALQIYKLWRDIRKDIASEAFAKRLAVEETGPAPL